MLHLMLKNETKKISIENKNSNNKIKTKNRYK